MHCYIYERKTKDLPFSPYNSLSMQNMRNPFSTTSTQAHEGRTTAYCFFSIYCFVEGGEREAAAFVQCTLRFYFPLFCTRSFFLSIRSMTTIHFIFSTRGSSNKREKSAGVAGPGGEKCASQMLQKLIQLHEGKGGEDIKDQIKLSINP